MSKGPFQHKLFFIFLMLLLNLPAHILRSFKMYTSPCHYSCQIQNHKQEDTLIRA